METVTLTVSSPRIPIRVAWTSLALAEVDNCREVAPPNSSRNELRGSSNGINGGGVSDEGASFSVAQGNTVCGWVGFVIMVLWLVFLLC